MVLSALQLEVGDARFMQGIYLIHTEPHLEPAAGLIFADADVLTGFIKSFHLEG